MIFLPSRLPVNFLGQIDTLPTRRCTLALALVAAACSGSPPEPRDPKLDDTAVPAPLPADTARPPVAPPAPPPSAPSAETTAPSPPDAGAAPPPKDAYVIRLRTPSRKPSSPPVVHVAPPTVGPSIPPELVRAVVHRTSGQNLYRCYENANAKNPTLAGRIRVAFTIGASGDVPSASIEPPGLDKDLDACVVAQFLRLHFPAPPGGGKVQVMFPIEFRPE